MTLSLTWLRLIVLVLCFSSIITVPNTDKKCKITELLTSSFNFDLLHWSPWNVIGSKDGHLKYYNISLCSPLKFLEQESAVSHLFDGQVKTLASFTGAKLKEFSSGYGSWLFLRGPSCPVREGVNYSIIFHFECGSTLGSPTFIIESSCEIFFSWRTSAVCSKSPSRREVPCYVYDKNGFKRDLNPLIKQSGGYQVRSTNPALEFFINVCSDIVPDDYTKICPKDSAACRKIGSEHIAFGSPNSRLQLNGDDLILKYDMTNGTIPANCDVTPQTTVTFKCPLRGRAKAPLLVSDANCHYEVEWETEYACPENILIGNQDHCKFTKEDHEVSIDLSPLSKEEGNYQVSGNVNDKKMDFFLNVCGSLGNNTKCSKTQFRTNSACVYDASSNISQIIGKAEDSVLRYADGKITLSYKGSSPCNGTDYMSTVIDFKCNETAENNGTGKPEFISLENCIYFFEWETKHACINHPLSNQCFVDNGAVHIDLGDLAVQKGELPWIALNKHNKNSSDSSSSQYFINICSELPEVKNQVECGPGVAACKIENGTVVSLGKFTSPPKYMVETQQVQLEYTEGSSCGNGKKRKSIITFICKPGHLNTAPMLVRVSEDDCVYEFEWHTAESCPEAEIKGSNCQIVDDTLGLSINLAPLQDKNHYMLVSDSYTYYINVCGKVKGTPCDENVGKTQNAAACQVENKSEKPVKYWKLGEPNSELIYLDGLVNLTYTQGTPYNDDNHTPRTTMISFICDPKAARGSPKFIDEVNYSYVFHWYTSFVCPSVNLFECVATDPVSHQQYDLSRLTKSNLNWEVTNILEQAVKKFYLNVCHRLNPTPKHCSSEAAACSVSVTDGKEEALIPNLGQPHLPLEVTSEGHLQLQYKSGDLCVHFGEKVNYSTVIHFLCMHDLQVDGIRFLGVVGECEYSFLWMTRAACPIEIKSAKSCAITHPESGYVFDLNPLNIPSGYIAKSGSQTFQLNICGNLSEGACQISKDSSSSNDISVCKIDTNGNASILGHANDFEVTLSEDGYISLIYEGPSSKVIIIFECSYTAGNSTQFIRQEKNEYLFNFKTPLVCQSEPYDCTFTDYLGRQYDLSPLSLDGTNWDVTDKRSTFGDVRYHINFCKPLSIVNGYSCPGGAVGACQTSVKNFRKEGYNLGYLNDGPVVTSSDTITIHYKGGSLCHGQFQRSTRINLICSSYQEAPVFIGETPECEYIFSFQTPVACPLKTFEGENCTVIDTVHNYGFDLTFLHKSSGNYNVTIGEYTYLINVCGNLNDPPNACKGAASCQTKPSDSSFAISAGLSNDKLLYKDGVIQLTYQSGKGGCHKKYNRSTVITFICDTSDKASEGPYFISEEDDCTYMFEWKTEHACPPYKSRGCSVVNEKGEYFDLGQLTLNTNNYAVLSPFVFNKAFVINVCRSVVQHSDIQCPYTSAVCLVDFSKSDSTTGTQSLGRVVSDPYFEDGKITLHYSMGDPCLEIPTNISKNMESIIRFECDHTETDSDPEYVGKEGCTYYFAWITSAACPIVDSSDELDNTSESYGNCTALNPQTGFLFDFNLLKRNDPYIVHSTTNHVFLLNICDDVKNSSCGSGVGVCQQEAIGNRHWISGKSNSHLHYQGGVLYLNYTNGDFCHQKQFQRNTIIQFICDPTYFDLGYPVFLYESENCTYYFEWKTDLACEKKVHCAVRNGSDIIDLSLLAKSGNYIASSSVDSGALHYLRICHPLDHINSVMCPHNAAACRIGFNHDVMSLGSPVMPPFLNFEGYVTLIYTNGSQCVSNPSERNKAMIIFICDPSALQGVPTFVNFDSIACVYIYEWRTNIVCPKEAAPKHSATCSFTDNMRGLNFDLSPLRKIGSAYRASGFPRKYGLNICGSVNASESGPCSSAAVCSIEENKEINYGEVDSATFSYDGKRLWLEYSNGSDCPFSDNHKRSAQVIFVCDATAGLGTPSFYMNLTCSLVFVWRTSLVCVAHEKECAVMVNGTLIDLHILSSITHSWDAYDTQENRYWINICHGIIKSPDSLACPHSTAICKVDKSGKAVGLGLTETLKLYPTDSGIMLTYSRGDSSVCLSDKQQATTQILFTCGTTFGKPFFISGPNDNCVFNFSWKTNAACPEISEEVVLQMDGKLLDSRLNLTMDISPMLNKTYRIQSNEQKEKYIYLINMNNGMKYEGVGNSCRNAAVCQTRPNSFYRDIGTLNTLHVYLKGSELQMILTSLGKSCGKKQNRNVTSIFILQCSSSAGLGNPIFLHESGDCQYIFAWDTELLCPYSLRPSKNESALNIIAPKEKTPYSRVSSSHIVIALVFSILLVGVILFIAKKERRENLTRKVKGAFGKIHIPRFRYRRVDGESMLLADGGTASRDDGSDVDIIT